MMYTATLNFDQYEHLCNLLSWHDYNEYDYSKQDVLEVLQSETRREDKVDLCMNADQKIALLDYIQDKKMEYGFDGDWEINDIGRLLSLIWDEIYVQTNV